MTRTIQKKVEEELLRGSSPEQAWRATMAAFPHNCVSWNYITKIKRDLERKRKTAGSQVNNG